MLTRMRARLTYANLMATLAVFIALGGGVYAASLSKNSVKAKQIAKDAVRASEIKADAVGSSEISNGAIGGGEIGEGAVGAAKIGDGAVGTAKIADGAVGAAKIGDGQVGLSETAAELGFQCPTGTSYLEGACIETDLRPGAVWGTAGDTCVGLNRRLPTIAELHQFRLEPGITLIAIGEWTDTRHGDDDGTTITNFVQVVNDNGVQSEVAVGAARQYRCVASPSG